SSVSQHQCGEAKDKPFSVFQNTFSLTPSTGCTSAPSGLVSWWTGDGTAKDLIGSNDGTLTGGVGYTTGKVGQAFEFGGGVVQIPHASNLSFAPTSQMSVEFWAYRISGSSIMHMVGKRQGCSGI